MENHDYESPAITDIASVHELTLDVDKDFHPKSDGYTFHHQALNVS
jgi:hypothetical protein